LAAIGGRSQTKGEIIANVTPVGDQVDQDDRLHPIPAAAERLGISNWTLRWWIQRGQVASHKLFGRRLIAESEIRRLIEQSRVPARAEAQ
jgi:excisionase family DNA binding protein